MLYPNQKFQLSNEIGNPHPKRNGHSACIACPVKEATALIREFTSTGMQVLLFNYSIENFDQKQTMGKDIFSMPDLCTRLRIR